MNEVLVEEDLKNEIPVETKMNEIVEKVKMSPEVQKLSNEIDLSNSQSIMSYGQDTAKEISQFSDRILSTITNTSVDDSGKLLLQLNSIMTKFDKKDFDEKKQGFLTKIFSNVKDSLNKLITKYETMDKEISKIYVEIKQYENEINKANVMLGEMYEKNLMYYENLEKYIQAGQLVIERIKTQIIPELEQKATSGEQMDAINLQNGMQTLEMVEQRVHDLELAKMVALQTAPQIKLIQKGNYNLERKIQSAFVITLPIFKTGLIQAITIKRQKIQADAMKALDETTNQMLLKNAQNIATQSVDIAKLTGSSSIKIETLEQTFATIMKGIEETKQVEIENKQIREDSKKRLESLQNQIKSKM